MGSNCHGDAGFQAEFHAFGMIAAMFAYLVSQSHTSQFHRHSCCLQEVIVAKNV